MSSLFTLLVWCLLFVLCWPLALLALVLWPLFWLLSLPLRLVGITFAALLPCCAPCCSCRPDCWAIRGHKRS